MVIPAGDVARSAHFRAAETDALSARKKYVAVLSAAGGHQLLPELAAGSSISVWLAAFGRSVLETKLKPFLPPTKFQSVQALVMFKFNLNQGSAGAPIGSRAGIEKLDHFIRFEKQARRDWVTQRGEIDSQMKVLRAGLLKGVQINRNQPVAALSDTAIPDTESGSSLELPSMSESVQFARATPRSTEREPWELISGEIITPLVTNLRWSGGVNDIIRSSARDLNNGQAEFFDEDMGQLEYFPSDYIISGNSALNYPLPSSAHHPGPLELHWNTAFELDPALEPNYHALGGSDYAMADYNGSGSDYVLPLPPPSPPVQPPDTSAPSDTSGPSRTRRRKREQEVDPENEVEGKRSRTASRRARGE
ncbi:hypothetical protein DFH09DRAFT_1284680 [Mycena vulgaris]|nr:hypothetical protein DFH09DRAFT_1284680 [Mycena vulgaris]